MLLDYLIKLDSLHTRGGLSKPRLDLKKLFLNSQEDQIYTHP